MKGALDVKIAFSRWWIFRNLYSAVHNKEAESTEGKSDF